jgi:polar amino acid transport system substrate-binding protein
MMIKSLAVLCLLGFCRLLAADTSDIRLSTLEWPPYTGATLPDGGYATAVVRAAFAAEGRTVEIRFYPWARALSLAETGRIDGVFPEYYDPQQRPALLLSAPFPGGPAGLLKLSHRAISLNAPPGAAPADGFSQLSGLKIGLVRGYLNHPRLDAEPGLRREYARDDLQNLSKLLAGRVDLIFIDIKVAEALIREHFPDQQQRFEALQPPLLQPTLHLAVSRATANAEAILQSFNQGLEKITQSGELQRLRQAYGL